MGAGSYGNTRGKRKQKTEAKRRPLPAERDERCRPCREAILELARPPGFGPGQILGFLHVRLEVMKAERTRLREAHEFPAPGANRDLVPHAPIEIPVRQA